MYVFKYIYDIFFMSIFYCVKICKRQRVQNINLNRILLDTNICINYTQKTKHYIYISYVTMFTINPEKWRNMCKICPL